jgi:DNA polymerase III alpha subunit
MSNNIIPIFTSDASLGKSILSTDEPKEIKDDASISIFSIAKAHNLEQIYLVENSMISFISAYKQSIKLGKQLIFGIKFIINPNPLNKEDSSKHNDSKVIVWIKNSDGYKDLIKLFTAIHSNLDNYFWSKFDFKSLYRGNWKVLNDHITDNLILSIPFYDSFLHKNLLTYGSMIVPQFGKLKPTFILENHSLPFDNLLREYTINYCKEHNYEYIEGHSIYYYLNSDVRAFQMLKCITNREKFEMPNMEYFCQDTFSFESYQRRLK